MVMPTLHSYIFLIAVCTQNYFASNISSGNYYYAEIDTSLSGSKFQVQLTNLISKHISLSYNSLWQAFLRTDIGAMHCDDNRLGDIMSTKCWIPKIQQCGNYKVRIRIIYF